MIASTEPVPSRPAHKAGMNHRGGFLDLLDMIALP
jgi:hypothetical protein